jgi:predicted FMN-binding regulatory protein PaiB
MKNGIKSKHYYELLEWKDTNPTHWEYKATHVYGVNRLCDMNTNQLKHLYSEVFGKEI